MSTSVQFRSIIVNYDWGCPTRVSGGFLQSCAQAVSVVIVHHDTGWQRHWRIVVSFNSIEVNWLTLVLHFVLFCMLLCFALSYFIFLHPFVYRVCSCSACLSGVSTCIHVLMCIGIFNSPKYDVNPQPNTQGIRPLVGRNSGNCRSVMHVVAVILIKTCHFFFIWQYIFIWVTLSGR